VSHIHNLPTRRETGEKMTASSRSGSAQVNSPSSSTTKTRPQNQVQQGAPVPSPIGHPIINSSSVFQQVKQTQASLARLSRVHQQLQANTNNGNQYHRGASPATSSNTSSQQSNKLGGQSIQSSQQPTSKSSVDTASEEAGHHHQQQKLTTFVDCLIRRFKNCFNEDFCTVPMFVVGNLSPGSDGE